MRLQQLTALKQWHNAHRAQTPIEYHAWDAVLTLWVLGWMGLPAALLVGMPWALAGSAALYCAPELYLAARRFMNRRGALRCDWLAACADGAPPRTGRPGA